MEFSIKFDTVKSGWFIVYIERSKVIISQILYFFLWEGSGSVVECFTGDQGAAGSSLTGVIALWSSGDKNSTRPLVLTSEF